MGGLFAGLLRLDLNDDPLKEWVSRTVEASGITEEEIEAAGLKAEEQEAPQQIEIEWLSSFIYLLATVGKWPFLSFLLWKMNFSRFSRHIKILRRIPPFPDVWFFNTKIKLILLRIYIEIRRWRK